MNAVFRLEELLPDELKRRLIEKPALILPVGTIEWHSHHLPLGLDGIKAEDLATAVAERSGAVLAPTSWWAAGGVPFPYTLRLPGDLIERLLVEVLVQLSGMGFRVLVVMNGHYGLENTLAVRRAAAQCMRRTPATVLPIAEYEVLTEIGARGDHAGVWETSLLWANRPGLVRLEEVGPDKELPGVVGDDPRGKASRELGLRGVGVIANAVSASIERSLNESPIDRARYLNALEMSIRTLEALGAMRETRRRSEVPPVATPAWIEHLRALNAGRYEEAIRAANAKLSDLSL